MSYDGDIIASVTLRSVSRMAEILFRMACSRGPGDERLVGSNPLVEQYRPREHRKVFELNLNPTIGGKRLQSNLCRVFQCLVLLTICAFTLPAMAGVDTWDAWNWNAQGAVGLVDFNTGGGWNQSPGSTLYAFDVLGNAGTFFSDLGTPVNYQCCIGGAIGGTSSVVGFIEQANQFTAGLSGSVSTIDVGLGWVTGANSANVSIWTSSGPLGSGVMVSEAV